MIAAASRIIAALIVVGALLFISTRPVTIEQVAMQVTESSACIFVISSTGEFGPVVCNEVGLLDLSRARWIGP